MRRTTLISGLVLATAVALPAATMAQGTTQVDPQPATTEQNDDEFPIGLLGLGGLLGLAGLMRRSNPTHETTRTTLGTATH